MTSIRLVLTVLVAGIMLGGSQMYAEVSAADTTEERLQELGQKIRILARNWELETEKVLLIRFQVTYKSTNSFNLFYSGEQHV